MSTFREVFHKATGFTYDVESYLSKLSEEEKAAFYMKIVWQSPAGIINTGGWKGEAIAKNLVELAEKLGIDPNDPNGDGTTDNLEEKIQSKIELILGGEDAEAAKEIIDNIQNGGEVTVNSNISVSKTISINEDTNITLDANMMSSANILAIESGKTVTVSGDGTMEVSYDSTNANAVNRIFDVKDGKVKISNGAFVGPRVAVVSGENASMTVSGGELNTYYAESPVILVGANGGKVEITDGTFGCKFEGKYYANKYLLNVNDSLLTGGKNANEIISVTGGTFIGFDPSKSESENPVVSFVADGYEAVEQEEINGCKVYKVQAKA